MTGLVVSLVMLLTLVDPKLPAASVSFKYKVKVVPSPILPHPVMLLSNVESEVQLAQSVPSTEHRGSMSESSNLIAFEALTLSSVAGEELKQSEQCCLR